MGKEDIASDEMEYYISIINKYPLLNYTEERDIGERLKELDSQLSRITDEDRQERDSYLSAQEIETQKNSLRQYMINCNLRLVVSIAKKYKTERLSLMDLVSEGNLGLILAVDRFDFSRGNRFSTYATYWVKHQIQIALASSSRLCSIPLYMHNKMNELEKTRIRLLMGSGRKPTEKELSREMSVSEDQLNIIRKSSYYLSSSSGDEDDRWVSDTIVDSGNPDALQLILDNDSQRELMDLINSFPDRVSRAVKMRFGLAGNDSHTLKEIGMEIDLSAERVRQLLNYAIEEIRNHRPLRDLVYED